MTAIRATDEAFPSENRPTAQTTPTATAVPSEASASRADSAADRDLRMGGIMTAGSVSARRDRRDGSWRARRRRARYFGRSEP